MPSIIEMIQDAESVYVSLRQKRITCMAQLRAMGVAFKDIESRLFKEARREGYYQEDSQLESSRKRGISWIIAIDRFVKWVNNNYKGYDVAKEKKDRKAKKGEPVVERRPAKVSEEKASKLLESDENRQAIEIALINRGAIVIDDGLLTEDLTEKLLEDDNNLNMVIVALEGMGYKVE